MGEIPTVYTKWWGLNNRFVVVVNNEGSTEQTLVIFPHSQIKTKSFVPTLWSKGGRGYKFPYGTIHVYMMQTATLYFLMVNKAGSLFFSLLYSTEWYQLKKCLLCWAYILVEQFYRLVDTMVPIRPPSLRYTSLEQEVPTLGHWFIPVPFAPKGPRSVE